MPTLKRDRRPTRFICYRDNAGEYRWHLKASNGKIIAESGEGYKRKTKCLDACLRFSRYVQIANATEIEYVDWERRSRN